MKRMEWNNARRGRNYNVRFVGSYTTLSSVPQVSGRPWYWLTGLATEPNLSIWTVDCSTVLTVCVRMRLE